jgi:hypothetical protein
LLHDPPRAQENRSVDDRIDEHQHIDIDNRSDPPSLLSHTTAQIPVKETTDKNVR